MTRRDLLALGLIGVGSALPRPLRSAILPAAAAEGRLLARPGLAAKETKRGLHELGLGGPRDGFLYVPKRYRPDRPAPLLVMLHGARGSARSMLDSFKGVEEETGLILVVPDSRGQKWDLLEGGFGPDILFLDRALELAFRSCTVDPRHLAVGGFSDGASYALSVGLSNGELFTHVLAFSPGFSKPQKERGEKPKIFISHGKRDEVLAIDMCSRRITAKLRDAGYDLLYREFDGPHTVPKDIAREALDWFLA